MNSEFCVAVHALVYLNHKACTLKSEALAENICTNPARVRKVMGELKKAGLVSTKEGTEGGYLFEKDPKDVNLRMIGEALSVRYTGTSWKSGSKEMECLVASGMAGIMEGIFEELNESCQQKLEGITILDIDQKIFG